MFTVFKVLLPIFTIIFIGFYSGKKNIVNKEIAKDLGKFIMNLSLTALLLNSISKVEPEIFLNIEVLLSFAICLLLVYLVTFFFYKYLLEKDNKLSALASLTSSQPNISFMGIIILLELYGPDSIVLIILLIVDFVVEVNRNNPVFSHE